VFFSFGFLWFFSFSTLFLPSSLFSSQEDLLTAYARLKALSPKDPGELLLKERRFRVLSLFLFRPPTNPLPPELADDPELLLIGLFFQRLENPDPPFPEDLLRVVLNGLFADEATRRVLESFFLKGKVCGNGDLLFCPGLKRVPSP
jgi:hypothetical protein